MSYFDPTTWQVCTPKEMLADLKKRRARLAARKEPENAYPEAPTGRMLILQETISPLDAYTYLQARFGPPIGMQTALARDDSDNLFHWDYTLKVGEKTIIFTGATQEVHVLVEDELSDAQWLEFITAMKADFGRVGKEKKTVLNGLEKWSIFPNQYLSIANRCADLYHDLATSLPQLKKLVAMTGVRANDPAFQKHAKRQGRSLSKITTASTELTILMPVMFESFLGLIVAGLTKPELKRNPRMFNAFVRAPLDVKIMDLANRCKGFDRAIADDNPVFRRFLTVVNKRNDVIHGNIDPVGDALDTVYFDGKRPLFRKGGDLIRSFWAGLIEQYKPDEVVADYLLTHEFILEILDHMAPGRREEMLWIMADTQPGWDDKRQIFGSLFPNHLAMSFYPGVKYDSDLQPAGAL